MIRFFSGSVSAVFDSTGRANASTGSQSYLFPVRCKKENCIKLSSNENAQSSFRLDSINSIRLTSHVPRKGTCLNEIIRASPSPCSLTSLQKHLHCIFSHWKVRTLVGQRYLRGGAVKGRARTWSRAFGKKTFINVSLKPRLSTYRLTVKGRGVTNKLGLNNGPETPKRLEAILAPTSKLSRVSRVVLRSLPQPEKLMLLSWWKVDHALRIIRHSFCWGVVLNHPYFKQKFSSFP